MLPLPHTLFRPLPLLHPDQDNSFLWDCTDNSTISLISIEKCPFLRLTKNEC
jgi:hypothetical protein